MPDLEHLDQPRRSEVWPDGVPISRSYFRQDTWIPALSKAEVPSWKFHAMRASHGSQVLAGEATMAEVMDRVGHREWTTTQRYVGRLPDADERNLSALDRI